MGSKRLPNKAIIKVNGKEILAYLIDGLKQNISADRIVICTSTNESDDNLEVLAKNYGVGLFRGYSDDVMGRFLGAAEKYNAKYIFRVTGDNPLTYLKNSEEVLECHIKNNAEYTFCNQLPVGCRSEIISTEALQRIYDQIEHRDSTEYMTYFLNRQDKLRVNEFSLDNYAIKFPNLYLTIDTKNDLNKFELIINKFNHILDLEEIIKWIYSDKNLIKLYQNPPPNYKLFFNTRYIDDKK